MSRATADRPSRRIAVALDASPSSQHSLGLIAAIAAALDAELEGIFVEDTELLRTAGLPFLREIRLASLCESVLDAERLGRELRAAARRVRAQLERSATERGLAWSFRVWRGDLEAEILGAALDAEWFALGRIGRFAPLPRLGRKQPPSHARPGALRVGVLQTGGEATARALAIALELARRGTAEPILILQAEDASAMARLREQVMARLGAAGALASLLTLQSVEPARLAAMVRASRIDLMILEETNPLLAKTALWSSLETLGCPVVIGR